MSKNFLSTFGRMNYTLHLLCYPGLFAFYAFVVKPYNVKKAEKAKIAEMEGKPKAKKVDPDLFNPFSPIPYHNSLEVKYNLAHINMHNYLN